MKPSSNVSSHHAAYDGPSDAAPAGRSTRPERATSQAPCASAGSARERDDAVDAARQRCRRRRVPEREPHGEEATLGDEPERASEELTRLTLDGDPLEVRRTPRPSRLDDDRRECGADTLSTEVGMDEHARLTVVGRLVVGGRTGAADDLVPFDPEQQAVAGLGLALPQDVVATEAKPRVRDVAGSRPRRRDRRRR